MRILYRLDLRTGKEIKGASPSIFTHIHTHTHTHTHRDTITAVIELDEFKRSSRRENKTALPR